MCLMGSPASAVINDIFLKLLVLKKGRYNVLVPTCMGERLRSVSTFPHCTATLPRGRGDGVGAGQQRAFEARQPRRRRHGVELEQAAAQFNGQFIALSLSLFLSLSPSLSLCPTPSPPLLLFRSLTLSRLSLAPSPSLLPRNVRALPLPTGSVSGDSKVASH